MQPHHLQGACLITLAGYALQELQLGRTRLIRRQTAEAKCAEPIVACRERDDGDGIHAGGAGVLRESRPAAFDSERWDHERLLIHPDPRGGVLIGRGGHRS
jgi:hypothetical protein